jgi:hypothetical protein
MGCERAIASCHWEGPFFNLKAKLRNSGGVMFQNTSNLSPVYSFVQTAVVAFMCLFKYLEAENAVTHVVGRGSLLNTNMVCNIKPEITAMQRFETEC